MTLTTAVIVYALFCVFVPFIVSFFQIGQE